MPLFETNKGRNERLLRVPFEDYMHRLERWLTDEQTDPAVEDNWALYQAWVLGGSVAATIAIQRCERIGAVWRDGDEEAALGLMEVFTLAMISAWYRESFREQDHSMDERSTAVRIATGNVLAFFDDYDEQSIEYFCRVDAQLNHDLDKNERPGREGVSTRGYAMLSALAEWFCGDLELDLASHEHPIDSSAAFQEMGVPHIGMKDMVALARGAQYWERARTLGRARRHRHGLVRR